MKKVIATLLALCLVLSMGVCAFAEGETVLTAATTGEIADLGNGVKTIDVVFSLSNLEALAAVENTDATIGGIEFAIKYDTAKLDLVASKTVALISHSYQDELGMDVPFDYTTEAAKLGDAVDGIQEAKVLAYNGNSNSKLGVALTGDLDVAQVTFKLADGVEIGDTTDIEFEIKNICDSCQNETGKAVSYNDAISAPTATLTLGKAEEPTPSEDPADPSKDPADPSKDPADPSKDPADPSKDPADPSKDPAPTTPSASTGSTKPSTTTPTTGDAGILAVGALMAVAAGAAFITMKKR